MKLIGLMVVRNERWVLEFSLRAALLAVDEMVVLDHASTDETPEILRRIAREHAGRVHLLSEDDPVWREAGLRQRTLAAARELGATHLWIVDADEVLTGNLLPSVRPALAELEPGECLWLRLLNLWGGLDRYRSDETSLSHTWTVAGFRDADHLCFGPEGTYDIHARFPRGYGAERQLGAMESDGGLFHLAFTRPRRALAKSAWYKMTEILRFPDAWTTEALNKRYDPLPGGELVRTVPVDPGWWSPYGEWLGGVDLGATSWHEEECLRLWATHGPGAFAGLDLRTTGGLGERAR